jgi:copper chaperone CopZ
MCVEQMGCGGCAARVSTHVEDAVANHFFLSNEKGQCRLITNISSRTLRAI